MSPLADPVQGAHSSEGLGVLRIAGDDARAFLQGQLSNDVRQLTRENSQLAALNTPQGRVVALLRLIERADGIHALLPASMIPTVIERLRKYVLRSKVTLAPAELAVQPILGGIGAEPARSPPAGTTQGTAAHREAEGVSVLRVGGSSTRALLVGPREGIDTLMAREQLAAADWNFWRLAQIAAGEPQVYPATAEHFVAQMLNLDLIGGLSFNKGCYTGQEIIVRTQHLGRIKRRMVRARYAGAPASPGDKLFEGEATAGEIVDAASRAGGTTEVLAVIQLAHAAGALHFAGAPLSVLNLPYPVETE